jgi:hypothetical protein
MTAEDEEFNRIEREASLRMAAVRETVSKKEWVFLTDKERNDLWRKTMGWGDPSHDDEDLMKAIEDASRRKNEM